LEFPIKSSNMSEISDNFIWSASVASFGMLLSNSEFKAQSSFSLVAELAQMSLGNDNNGYRKEFLGLVNIAKNTKGEL